MRTDVASGVTRRATLLLAKLADFENKPSAVSSGAEMKLTNKSFQSLFNVIKTLNEDVADESVPYGDSKLTELLKGGLGGNERAMLFITASASSYNISETLSTIKLGLRVRKVVNIPRVNYELNVEEYRKWLLLAELKLGELCAFVKQLVEGIKQEDVTSDQLWESIRAILKEEERENNPCRKSLVLGRGEQLKDLKWRELSRELVERGLPCERLHKVIKERNRAESLLADRQSEVIMLRRQNELLTKDKKVKEEKLFRASKETEMSTLEKSEAEHVSGLSVFREREAVIFLRYIRRLCWRMQTDITKSRSTDINEITSLISGAPDLSGLVDLDTLLLDRGLIERRMEDEEDDEEECVGFERDRTSFRGALDSNREENKEYLPPPSQPKSLSIQPQAAPPRAPSPATTTPIPFDISEHGLSVTSSRFSPRTALPQNQQLISTRFASWFSTRNGINNRPALLNKSPIPDDTFRQKTPPPPFSQEHYDSTIPIQLTPERHEQLEHDLRIMTRKCIDLQIKLDEEKKTTEIIMNRHGSLRGKRLAQEVLELRKDRDKMMQNSKAAMWKLQELYVVNKVLGRKVTDEKRQVTFLEEGFQRLQDKFRDTVLKSMEGDKELREKVSSLEKVVERLTVTRVREDEENMGGEMNLVLRGETDVVEVNGRRAVVWRRRKQKKREVRAKRRVKWDFKTEWWRRKREREILRSLR